jgi:site-specific recombinase XerD
MMKLKRSNINGNVLTIRMQKTTDFATIILNPIAQNILYKYSGNEKILPLFSEQRYNGYIKEMCLMAGITDDVIMTSMRGRRVDEVMPKYKLMSSHTARRTFITLALEAGMRAETVMKMSGHKSMTSFKKYINITTKIIEKEFNEAFNLEQPLRLVVNNFKKK